MSAKGDMKHVIIYTDGSCRGNPGRGGYGAVLCYKNHRKELSGGFRNTTNNRMEILAAVIALETLKEPCQVTLHSDSKYVVNAITKGWAARWRKNNWKRNKTDYAQNPDLWERFLNVLERHQVKMVWVKGHAGIAENERCDELCTSAADSVNLSVDTYFEENS